MKISQIELHVNKAGMFRCRIRHDGKTVLSGWNRKAPAAYTDAESRLIYKPAYVESVPRAE